MKKKLVSMVLATVMTASLAACGETTAPTIGGQTATTDNGGSTAAASDVKIGVILVGDENEGYTYAHIDGIKKAAANVGISEDNILWKYSVPEDESCYEAAVDLVDQGCKAVFSNSYGHQSFMQQAAGDFADVQFVAMTGDTAAMSGLSNFSNAFTNVYESRYVSGVVAGMKVAELVENGALSDANYDADGKVLIGYVGAYPYAEVVSGYTAFFLGVQSVYKDVSMEVTYTNSWFDIAAEGEAANALMADGCVIIGQHADSTGAPAAIQAANAQGKPVYSVGYNVDMLSVAPDAALTSATNNWSVYYTDAFNAVVSGQKIPTDWSKGYADDAVAITALGASAAEGTQAKVDEVIAAIKDGSLHVFSTDSFTVGGSKLDSHKVDMNGDFDNEDEEDKEAIWDGYFHESELRAAPSFDLRIDGIKELTAE
ncbi:MAG: BMP family ABC transporter substrate-binding protein [Lachnospiraceae bacterium]|nr:BMP family ABC transporter substrate-binding protein [Lachnospiraceae bacterium]